MQELFAPGLNFEHQTRRWNPKMTPYIYTKRKEAIREEALKCGSPFVDSRWLGGTMTNMNTIRKRISRLEHIEKMEADGTLNYMTKKESNEILLEGDSYE